MGKSTLAKKAKDREVIGTDEYKSLPWPLVPLRMLADIQTKEPFVIEGVMVARMLRKAHQNNLPVPVDAVIYMTRPKVQRKPGHVSTAKGVQTVFDEWRQHNQHVPVFIEGARTKKAS